MNFNYPRRIPEVVNTTVGNDFLLSVSATSEGSANCCSIAPWLHARAHSTAFSYRPFRQMSVGRAAQMNGFVLLWASRRDFNFSSFPRYF